MCYITVDMRSRDLGYNCSDFCCCCFEQMRELRYKGHFCVNRYMMKKFKGITSASQKSRNILIMFVSGWRIHCCLIPRSRRRAINWATFDGEHACYFDDFEVSAWRTLCFRVFFLSAPSDRFLSSFQFPIAFIYRRWTDDIIVISLIGESF